MAYDQLSAFLQELSDARDLARIAEEVSPDGDIAALTTRVRQERGDGPALVFERVAGSSIPVVTNLLGSYARVCRALGTDSLDAVADRLSETAQPKPARGWFDQLRNLPRFREIGGLPPRVVRMAPCQQVVRLGRDIRMDEFPVPRLWPADETRLITAGQVCVKHPHTGERYTELVPVEVRDQTSLRILWTPFQAGHAVWREHVRLGSQMPVAVVLGGDPVLQFTASCPVPPQSEAWLFAGFLRGEALDIIPGRTVDLEVPAAAEIVFEGFVDPVEAPEMCGRGSRGTGFVGEPFACPVLRLGAVTSRTNPVFPVLVPGPPPSEDFWLHKAAERVCLPILRMFVPELVDYSFPHGGQGRNLCFVSLAKTHPGQARKAVGALWGHPLLMHTKFLVVVDADVDVQRAEEVWFAAGAHAHVPRDVILSEGPADWFDHATPTRGLAGKLALDATRKLPEEHRGDVPWPTLLGETPELAERVDRLWRGAGFGR
jgi:4-hydroxy-3-polyprenylbenzoate decarboxylase